jgi:hypothetical protein
MEYAALIVSGLSLAVALWSAVVSQRSLRDTRDNAQRDQALAYEREKADLLDTINISRGIYDRARIEISSLKATFEAEPDAVKQLLVNYTQLFTEYLPRIELAISNTTGAWNDVHSWSPAIGIHDLMHHKSRFKATLHEDQVAYDMGLRMVTIFREKLALAREHIKK